jgi:hypothetical protein
MTLQKSPSHWRHEPANRHVRRQRQRNRSRTIPPPITRPRGPTTTTARHARHRYRRSVSTLCSGAAPGDPGPRTCRSMSPWPTSTKSPPTGCAAAPQHGHIPGLASAHVGIPAHQDLIPSALATNLSVLRVFLTGGRAARRRGRARPKIRPLRHLSGDRALLRRPPYLRRPAMTITSAPWPAGGASDLCHRASFAHRHPAPRWGESMMNIEEAATPPASMIRHRAR